MSTGENLVSCFSLAIPSLLGSIDLNLLPTELSDFPPHL